MSSRAAEELQIPVPFGQLSAKVWGPATGRPVLALHGWQDNAGTFDLLCPHLDPNLKVVALDFPGHGLSSSLPPGSAYNLYEFLLHIKLAVNHLGWSKFSFLGHSMGGGLSMLFASLYPTSVDSIVSIDLLKPLTTSLDDLTWRTGRAIDSAILTFEKKKRTPPVYSYEEAVDRLVAGSHGSLNRTTAGVLMRRGSRPSDDGKGLVFTRDLQIQIAGVQQADDESCRAILSDLKCNLLVIKAKNGFDYESVEAVQAYQSMYAENCTNYVYTVLNEGGHHVHIDNPELVAPLVNSFLSANYAKL